MSPVRPMRPCATPGCGMLVTRQDGGRCKAHRADAFRQDRLRRGSSAARGYDARHRRWRGMVLRRHPLCPCGQPATEADHIRPLRDGGDWSLDNGQGMCKPCHSRKTLHENR